MFGEMRALREENAQLKELLMGLSVLEPLASRVEALTSLVKSMSKVPRALPAAGVAVSTGATAIAGSITDTQSEAAESHLPKPKSSNGKLKVWVGSWNVGAEVRRIACIADFGLATSLQWISRTHFEQDPFDDLETIDPSDPRHMEIITSRLESFVPSDCDLYVMGVQEGVSDTVFDAVAAYTGCFRLPLMTKLMPAKESSSSQVRSRRMGQAMNVATFYEDFEAGVDMAPQPPADMLDRVWGRGDGAFLRQKFTGIAVFVQPVVAPFVRLLGVYKHAFGAKEGSKGGAAVALGVYDQTMAFVNVHMASKKTELRRQQYADLVVRLGHKLGARGMDLLEQFHHVVWLGDLNYHLEGIDADSVLTALQQGHTQELLENHDELVAEKEAGHTFWGFVEPVMSPDFLPTYKKQPLRGVIDYSDPSWPDQVYNSKYKEPLYKGGRVVDRVPSWTDRIQFHSLPSRSGSLAPELLDPAHPDTSPHNYHAVNDGMDISDHSPIFATFQLDIKINELDVLLLQQAEEEAAAGDALWALKARQYGISGHLAHSHADMHPSLHPLVVILRLTDVQVDYKAQMRTPRAVSMLFPLPYEDSDDLPERAKVVRADKTFSKEARSETLEKLTGTVKSLVSRAGRLPSLHMLLKVSLDDNTKAQAVVNMGSAGFKGQEHHKHVFFAPLSSNGLPLTDRTGKPVNVMFTLEMSAHPYTVPGSEAAAAAAAAAAQAPYSTEEGGDSDGVWSDAEGDLGGTAASSLTGSPARGVSVDMGRSGSMATGRLREQMSGRAAGSAITQGTSSRRLMALSTVARGLPKRSATVASPPAVPAGPPRSPARRGGGRGTGAQGRHPPADSEGSDIEVE